MPTNDLVFNQAATIINAIQAQATGTATIAPTNTSDFVTVAQTLLKMGPDPILNAISQVLTRTIFSVRPYERKFGIVEVSESAYGNHIRKLQIADKGVQDDDRYKWPVAYDPAGVPPSGDGQSVDQQVLNKPVILSTNFYGQNVWQDSYTLFRDQLDNAFQGPDQLNQFTGMVVQNIADKLEQVRENLGRAVVANFIGGLIDENAGDRVIHLLTEYNTVTGATPPLTIQDVYQPQNYRAFIQWVYARVLAISDVMTERSVAMQTVVNNLPIMHHTPKSRQKLMMYAPMSHEMTTMALSNTYNEELLRFGAYETVNFWQALDTPDTINVTPGRIDATGAVYAPLSPISQAHVMGVLFDEEALGYAVTQSWASPAPFNARGGYTTTWLHETQRCWNDHTEKGVVLLLD